MHARFNTAADERSSASRIVRAIACLAALWLLNAALTFHNVWPTAFIHPSRELSVELAVILLAMSVWLTARAALPRGWLSVLAVLFVLGAIGRYAEVTAPALYGREVNLYWDLPHVSSVAAMLTRVASPALLVAGAIGVVAGFALLYVAALWSWRRVAVSLQSPLVRGIVSLAAVAVIVGFTFENVIHERPARPRFAMPIAQTYGHQFAKVGAALMERGTPRQLPPSPALASSLSRIEGSDVLVVFIESYGRVAYDNRDFFDTLAPARGELAAAIHETGRAVASGYVTSPTFGGGSWLAHLSFLSGIDTSDTSRAQLLMTQTRRTFGHALAEHGYRRVGLMPGLKMDWPEGTFYQFDRLYDDAALDYHGPAFGWWRIPDQYSLAKLDALEMTPRSRAPGARPPLFVFFPTISTHTPFRPTPPYQPDWSRLLGAQPFDEAPLQRSLAQLPQWSNLAPSYQDALDYSLRTLAGYLRTQARENLVMIIVGDHQPPAVVSGPNAPWDVPVHVVTRQPALLETLEGCGFVSGLIPAPAVLGPLHQLGPTLLYAFENTASRAGCPMRAAEGSSSHRTRAPS